MSVYADMMNRLDLKVSSPDGKIRARLAERDRFGLGFAPGAYPRYTEAELSRQLAGLGQLVWVGRRRASITARAAALGEYQADDERGARDSAERELFAKRKLIEATGVSSRRWIAVTTLGWTRWRVKLGEGVTDALTEDEFTAEAASVFPSLMADYRVKYDALLEEYHRQAHPDRHRPR